MLDTNLMDKKRHGDKIDTPRFKVIGIIKKYYFSFEADAGVHVG